MSSDGSPAPPALIEVTGLILERTDGFALRVPALRVGAGQLLGVIGANGSGKTTLLSCLLGSTRPDSGQISVLGVPAAQMGQAQREAFGLQLQGAGFNELHLVRDIQRLHHLAYERSDPAVFDAFGVPALGAKRYGQLSSGEQQRVQLAMALAHHPGVAMFDEPTSNLDPAYEEAFCAMLRARREAGGFCAVVITHASRVVALCDRLMILKSGNVDALGTPAELVTERFDRVGCRIVGSERARVHAREALRPAARSLVDGENDLLLYGGDALREAALAHLQGHRVDRFTLWTPDATDLLEGLRRG